LYDFSQANLKEKSEQYMLCKLYHESQLTLNTKLKTENEMMAKQNEQFKQDLARYKACLTNGSKPVVDLTEEDNEDSDLEIVSEIPCKKRKISCTKTINEIIELNDDEIPEEVQEEATSAPPALTVEINTTTSTEIEVTTTPSTPDVKAEKPSSIFFASKPENNLLINPFALKPEEQFQDLEAFQNYILDQIPLY
jgi:hypothetical protein